jgi:hypothetical protein
MWRNQMNLAKEIAEVLPFTVKERRMVPREEQQRWVLASQAGDHYVLKI